jgi:hypothetical protein
MADRGEGLRSHWCASPAMQAERISRAHLPVRLLTLHGWRLNAGHGVGHVCSRIASLFATLLSVLCAVISPAMHSSKRRMHGYSCPHQLSCRPQGA